MSLDSQLSYFQRVLCALPRTGGPRIHHVQQGRQRYSIDRKGLGAFPPFQSFQPYDFRHGDLRLTDNSDRLHQETSQVEASGLAKSYSLLNRGRDLQTYTENSEGFGSNFSQDWLFSSSTYQFEREIIDSLFIRDDLLSGQRIK